jgi:hypothetical protein
MGDREQRIRERAFALWQAAGRPEGREHEHWQEAERAIDEAESMASTPGATAAPPIVDETEMREAAAPDETKKKSHSGARAKATGARSRGKRADKR